MFHFRYIIKSQKRFNLTCLFFNIFIIFVEYIYEEKKKKTKPGFEKILAKLYDWPRVSRIDFDLAKEKKKYNQTAHEKINKSLLGHRVDLDYINGKFFFLKVLLSTT